MSTIAERLTSLRLPEYARRFTENDVDLDVLPELTDQGLERLDVSLEHHRKILHASGTCPLTPQGRRAHRRRSPQGNYARRRLAPARMAWEGLTALAASP